MASPIAANADTRWPCVTRAVANMSAIISKSSVAHRNVRICAPHRSTHRLRAFLEAVAPAEIDALSKARKTHLQSERDLRHAEEQQVERLRYQAALAERQFNRADPDNRLVTGELERRWEAALSELRRAEEALVQRTMHKSNEPLGVPHLCVPR